jgi:hypothetical protein
MMQSFVIIATLVVSYAVLGMVILDSFLNFKRTYFKASLGDLFFSDIGQALTCYSCSAEYNQSSPNITGPCWDENFDSSQVQTISCPSEKKCRIYISSDNRTYLSSKWDEFVCDFLQWRLSVQQ